MQEIHLFIIWSKALDKEYEIISDIKKKFNVLCSYKVSWSKERFAENLTRFYGQNLPKDSHKEKHCGNDAFSCIVVKDNSPIYETRKTSKGDRVVNVNLFDAKQLYRSWTGGGHKIHATDNIEETKLQTMLLFGKSYNYYLDLDNKQIDVNWNNELIGANGWKSLESVFKALNETLEYVILRNFESIESELNNEHPDIDLLVGDLVGVRDLLNAKKTSNKKNRVQYQVLIANKLINFDFRHIGDNYYDAAWQKKILSNRIFEEYYFRPILIDYYYTLLYHAILHKPELSADYADKLLRLKQKINVDITENSYMSIEKSIEDLTNFMKEKEYSFTQPIDYSVYWNYHLSSKLNIKSSFKRIIIRILFSLKGLLGFQKRRLKLWLGQLYKRYIFFTRYHYFITRKITELGIKDVKVFKFTSWHDGFAFYYGLLNEKKVFVKISTKHFFLGNEVAFYDIFNSHLELLQILDFFEDKDIQILVLNFSESRELQEDDILNNPSILLELYKIIKTINSKECIHRDIKLNNFLIEDDKIQIIDFTFSTSFKKSKIFRELLINHKEEYKLICNLGEGLNPNIFEWNDFYSMNKIIESVLCNEIENQKRKEILGFKQLFVNEIPNNNHSVLKEELK